MLTGNMIFQDKYKRLWKSQTIDGKGLDFNRKNTISNSLFNRTISQIAVVLVPINV